MSSISDNLALSVDAVGSIVLCVVIGAATAHTIPHRAVVVKDMTFIVTQVCVPSYLFVATASSFTIDLLDQKAVVLACFCVALCVIGWCVAQLVGRYAADLPKAFNFLLGMYTAFPSAVVLPVSVLTALDVPWLTDEVRQQAITYVFVYSMTQTVMFWVVLNHMVRKEAARIHSRDIGDPALLPSVMKAQLPLAVRPVQRHASHA